MVGTARALSNGHVQQLRLLAIPLFILAAEFMTIGSITERLLSFWQRVRRPLPRRPRPRQRGAEHHLRGNVGLGPRGRRELGKLMQKMMSRTEIPASFAAPDRASSVIGPIIPPSIPMVI